MTNNIQNGTILIANNRGNRVLIRNRRNLIGNFIMFMPMVILLDLVFKKIKKKSHCVFILIGICVILELIQCFTLVGP